MAFLPDLFKKNAVAVPTVFRTEQARQLVERFENIKNLADAADKILMLEKLRLEVVEFETTEQKFRDEKRSKVKMLVVVAGVTVVTGGLGMVVLGSAGGALLALVGEIGSIPFALRAADSNLRKYDRTFKDCAIAKEMQNEINALKSKIIENADVHLMAESPRGLEAFTKFPELKDKFMLAVMVDKVVADKKALRDIPNLDKVAKGDPDSAKVTL